MNHAAMQGMQGMAAMQNQQRAGPSLTPENILIFLRQQYTRVHTAQPGTWQSEVQAAERAGHAHEILSCYRLAQPNMPFQQAARESMKIEAVKFTSSPDKASYFSAIQHTLGQLKQVRETNVQNMMQAQSQMMGQPRGMPTMPAMPGQGGLNMNNQQMPQAFNAQLAQPMQPTPIPGANQPGLGQMGMQASGVAAPQMQAQRSQQPQQFPAGQPTPQPAAGGPPRVPLTAEETHIVTQASIRLRTNASREVMDRLRMEWERIPPEKKATTMKNDINNFFAIRFKHQALQMYLQQRSANAGQSTVNNPSLMMAQPGAQFQQRNQTPAMQSSVPDFASILEQQQQSGLRSQAGGNDVVPASNNNNNQQQMATLLAMQGQAGMGNNLQLPNGLGMRPGMTPRQIQQVQQQQHQAQQQHAQQQQHRLALQQAVQRQAQGTQTASGLPGQIQQQSPANMSLLTQPIHQPAQQPPNPGGPTQAFPSQQGLDPQGLQALQRAQMAQQGRLQPRQIPPDLAPHIPPGFKQQLQALGDQQFQHLIMHMRQKLADGSQKNQLANMAGQVVNRNAQGPNQMTTQIGQNLQNGINPSMTPQPNMSNDTLAQAQRLAQMSAGQQQPIPGAQQLRLAGPVDQKMLMELDAQPVAETTIGMLRPNVPIPDAVRTWGQLKAWVRSSPGALGVDDGTLLRMQLLQHNKIVFPPGGLKHASPQVPQGQIGQLPHMGSGLAPTAPMVPQSQTPQPGLQMPQGFNGMALPTITIEDIRKYGMMLAARGQNPSEEEIRAQLLELKIKHAAMTQARLAQGGQLSQQMPQQSQSPAMPPPSQNRPSSAAQMSRQPQAAKAQPSLIQATQTGTQQRPPQLQQQQLSQQQQMQQQKQQQLQHQLLLQQQQQQQQQPPQAPQQLGHKAVNRDVAEAQPAPAQPTAGLSGPIHIPPEIFATLTKQQTAMLAEGKIPPGLPANFQLQLQARQNQAQQQAQQQSQLHGQHAEFLIARQKLSSMSKEIEQQLPQAPVVTVSQQDREKLTALLVQRWGPLTKGVEQTMHFVLKSPTPKTQEQLKQILTARVWIGRQLKNPNQAPPELRDQMTCSARQISEYARLLLNFVSTTHQIRAIEANKLRNEAQPPAPSAQPNVSAPAAVAGNTRGPVQQKANAQPAPEAAKAANNRRDKSKPPPAPTDTKAPFTFAGQSPQGTPMYAQNAVGNIDLKLPPGKKQKSKASTGAAASATSTPATPRLNNKSTPTKKAQQTAAPPAPPVKQEPQKPTFRCGSRGCPRMVTGYDTQAELDAHIKDMHVMPADPVTYVLDKVRNALGLDENGNEKAPEPTKTDSAALKKPAKGAETASTTPLKAGSAQGTPSSKTSNQAPKTDKGQLGTDAEMKEGADSPSEDADKPKRFFGNVALWDELGILEDPNDIFNVDNDVLSRLKGDKTDKTDSEDQWDLFGQSVGVQDWFAAADISRTSSSSGAGSHGASSSSPGSGLDKLTPASSSKKSPDLNQNGKRGRDVAESEELELELHITDTDYELEELMNAWADGGPNMLMADNGAGASGITGVAGEELEFGGMKVVDEADLVGDLAGGEFDPIPEGSELSGLDLLGPLDGIPGWN